MRKKIFPVSGQKTYDYILIGRMTTNDCSFERLVNDLNFALEHI